jgi:lipopolysaccharide/colanic/teichoic acid biosynthesis glycosyltransferase
MVETQHPAAASKTKRLLDVTLAAVAILALSPLMACIGVAIWVTMGSPIFFRQQRVGLKLSQFELIKFRTMRAPRPDEAMLLTDSDRVTSLGRLLRRTSLDELPTLFNVIRGQMSLVGPRPLLPVHYELLTSSQAMRTRVRPGITGLAQVSGRQSISFASRVELDIKYLDTWTLATDVMLILRTARLAILGAGVDTGQAFEQVDDIGLKAKVLGQENLPAEPDRPDELGPGPRGAEAKGGA